MDVSKLHNDITLEEFLKQYKIPGVGPVLSKEIADKVRNASTLRNLLEENNLKYVLKDIDGLSDKTSEKITVNLMDVDFFLNLEEMEDSGFKMFDDKTIYDVSDLSYSAPRTSIKDLSSISGLSGKNVVITGALSVPRRFVETTIVKLGGKVSSSVSKNTDILVYSVNDGTDTTKFRTAKKINDNAGYEKVQMLTEADFNALVKKVSTV